MSDKILFAVHKYFYVYWAVHKKEVGYETLFTK